MAARRRGEEMRKKKRGTVSCGTEHENGTAYACQCRGLGAPSSRCWTPRQAKDGKRRKRALGLTGEGYYDTTRDRGYTEDAYDMILMQHTTLG